LLLLYFGSREAGSGVKHIQHGGVVERRQCRSGSWLGAGAGLPSSRLQHGPQRVHSRAPSRLGRRVSVVVGTVQRFGVRRSVLHDRRGLLQVRASVRISATAAAVSRRTGRICGTWRVGDNRIGRIGRGQLAIASALYRPQHVRLSQLSGGRPTRSGRRAAPPQAQCAQLPPARVWQGVQQDVTPQGTPALAHRRTTVPLQLAVLRQTIHEVRRTAAAHSHTHRRETIRLFGLFQAVHALRPPQQTHQDAPEQQEGVRVVGARRFQRRRRVHDIIAASRGSSPW